MSSTKKSRLSHKKSRYGCSVCKTRHIRCDETRPECINCKIGGRDCSYMLTTSAAVAQSSTSSGRGTPEQAIPGSSGSVAEESSQLLASLNRHTDSSHLNLIHLELLYNFTCAAEKIFKNTPSEPKMVDIIVRHALDHEFLMTELLALSALHLSILGPEARQDLFQKESVKLLDLALSSFQEVTSQVMDKTNIVPVFLFSTLVGLHVFFETFTSEYTDLELFLDKLVHAIDLLRGIRAVLQGWWEHLVNSEIAPLLLLPESDDETAPASSNHEFGQLYDLIRSSDLTQAEAQACQEAIDQLLRVCRWWPDKDSSSDTTGYIGRATAWPVTQSAEYTALLAQRRPEALIILGHYAVFLHHVRNYWMVRGAGKFLFGVIENYLGERWSDWLRLPKAIILSSDLA